MAEDVDVLDDQHLAIASAFGIRPRVDATSPALGLTVPRFGPYVTDQGEQPTAITGKLEHPLPMDLYQRAPVVAGYKDSGVSAHFEPEHHPRAPRYPASYQ